MLQSCRPADRAERPDRNGIGVLAGHRDRCRAVRAAPRLVRASLPHLRPVRVRQCSPNLSKLLRHPSNVRRPADVVRPIRRQDAARASEVLTYMTALLPRALRRSWSTAPRSSSSPSRVPFSVRSTDGQDRRRTRVAKNLSKLLSDVADRRDHVLVTRTAVQRPSSYRSTNTTCWRRRPRFCQTPMRSPPWRPGSASLSAARPSPWTICAANWQSAAPSADRWPRRSRSPRPRRAARPRLALDRRRRRRARTARTRTRGRPCPQGPLAWRALATRRCLPRPLPAHRRRPDRSRRRDSPPLGRLPHRPTLNTRVGAPSP